MQKKKFKNKKNESCNLVATYLKKKSGITLIALVVTIVVLLILATITINLVINGGIISKTKLAEDEHKKAEAREKLALVLGDAGIEKYTNGKYNQDEFLSDFIKNHLKDVKIYGDIVIVDGYAFEIDRSVPKIGKEVGKESELAFPELNASVKLADDKKQAIITINTKEKKNGINKIEIWQEGKKIDEFTYSNEKSEITKEYSAKQNGKYTIKVYADLMTSEDVKVEGLVASVKFEPNGNEEWKKEHSTKVTINETDEKIINAKYCWLDSLAEPEEDKFTEELKNDDTIAENSQTLTGTYYLWTMLETESGGKVKWRSEGFNFDNSGPDVNLTYTALTCTSFKLSTSSIDEESGIEKYECYVGESLKETKTPGENNTNDTQEITITDAIYGNNSCYVIVTDKLGNETRKDITAKTLVDTTPPNITSFTAKKYSATGITLSATAIDTGSGVVKFMFYVDNVLKSTQTCSATTSSVTKNITVTGLTTGSHTCKVVAYDQANYNNTKTVSGSTKLYTWQRSTPTTTTTKTWKKSTPQIKKGVSLMYYGGEYFDYWRYEPAGEFDEADRLPPSSSRVMVRSAGSTFKVGDVIWCWHDMCVCKLEVTKPFYCYTGNTYYIDGNLTKYEVTTYQKPTRTKYQ